MIIRDLMLLMWDAFQNITISEVNKEGLITRKWVLRSHKADYLNLDEDIKQKIIVGMVLYKDGLSIYFER